ncbi:MAG: NTP transferase domain-containing protein [Bacteroidota bacterium]
MKNKTRTQRLREESLPAVILAAGEGYRLRGGNGGLPKPLTPLLGITLLERAILTCREAGIREFYVVVGCFEERMIPYIEELGRRFGISVRAVQNPNWKEGNGTSALASCPYVNGSFLLPMCDHLFDPDIIRRLIEAKDGAQSCLLAVDRRTDQIFDLKDATKVRLDGKAITAIGKGITPFDAVDAGLFLCRPDLFDALEKARRAGDGSLTGGVQRLIGKGKIRAMEIGDRFWHDVDTPESLSHAKRYLLARVSRSSEDGFIAQYLNRPLSRRISALLADTRLTPNAITILNFLIGLCGAFLFSMGEYVWTLLAGLLIQLSSILDGCDGEIARLKFQSGRFGAWLDTVLDRYADVAIAAGISYGYWLTHPEPIIWLGGALAITGFILASYTKKEYALCYQRQPPGGLLNKFIKRDVRLFALLVGALLNRPYEGMILVGLLSHFGIVWIFICAYRQRRHELQGRKTETL